MTRERAIEVLKAWDLNCSDEFTANEFEQAFAMAIKALEQEPCEDCISRAKVMDNYNGVETPVGYRKVVDMEVIKNMRSVYPKAKVGHWITKDGKEQGYDIAGVKTWYIQIVCSECGFIKTAIEGHTGQYHYCPNCGTEMQGVEEYGTRI